jgi:hypothetical protein
MPRVNLNVYSVASLDKRQDAVEVLESALALRGSDRKSVRYMMQGAACHPYI